MNKLNMNELRVISAGKPFASDSFNEDGFKGSYLIDFTDEISFKIGFITEGNLASLVFKKDGTKDFLFKGTDVNFWTCTLSLFTFPVFTTDMKAVLNYLMPTT